MRRLLMILVVLTLHPRPAAAMQVAVPSALYSTLAQAVAAIETSPDAENVIRIVQASIVEPGTVVLGSAFGPTRRLVIRPDTIVIPPLPRAFVVSQNAGVPILRFESGGYVTVRDLDIVRDAANDHHLIEISNFSNLTIERCRIGSIWNARGTTGWSNLEIESPTDVVVRNCILFSFARADFDRGIHAFGFDAPANSLRLYHNVVADYRVYGIHLVAGVSGSRLVLRNNVVSNHPDYGTNAEPVCFRSEVSVLPTLATSHNAVFASAAGVELTTIGRVPIRGANLVTLSRSALDDAFVERAWNQPSSLSPNPDFFRLEPLGPLHDSASDWGVIVGDAFPHAADLAVIDDLEKHPRPSGDTLHVDRGADQIETGTVSVEGVTREPQLRATPRRNPSDAITLDYRAGKAGKLVFEVFDLAGRRVHRDAFPVANDQRGVLEWRGPVAWGVYQVRVRLLSAPGALDEARSRVVVTRR